MRFFFLKFIYHFFTTSDCFCFYFCSFLWSCLFQIILFQRIMCRLWTRYSRQWNGYENTRKCLSPEMFQLLHVQYAAFPRWPIWGCKWQYHLWKWLFKNKCQRSSEWKFKESQISWHHTINVNRMWRQTDVPFQYIYTWGNIKKLRSVSIHVYFIFYIHAFHIEWKLFKDLLGGKQIICNVFL